MAYLSVIISNIRPRKLENEPAETLFEEFFENQEFLLKQTYIKEI